jgi:hypothetical protein
MNESGFLTLGEIAAKLGTQLWQVQRIVDRRLVPRPERVGPNQIFREGQVELVQEALARAGYLRTVEAAGGRGL